MTPGRRSLASCLLLFAAVFALYAATAAPGTLFGDPSEYQFVPAVLGIAHPPGYALYILLARLWQILVPVGTIAFRTNLLSAAVGAWAVTAVYLIVDDLQSAIHGSLLVPDPWPLAPIFAALTLAAAPDLWQHAVHANAHIVSAALAVTHIWLLMRWWRTEHDSWLAAFVVTLSLAATHHPITLMGIPAYGIFILTVCPHILGQPRTLLLLAGCLLLGLSPLLYYPLRSPSAPFGPTDMHTWDGFIRHVTARGLRINLLPFGLADQLDRLLVLWSLLRLQFLLPVILLIPTGLFYLARRAAKPALLLGLFLLSHLTFTLNTEQDVMAYLLLPFAALAVSSGLGAQALEDLAARLLRSTQSAICSTRHTARVVHCLLFLLLLLWPFVRGVQDLSRGISLRDFTAAEDWVEAVHRRFDGREKGAFLLSDWEHLTPLWAHSYTQGEKLDEADVEPVYISTATPWVEAVSRHIEEGPVYLPCYRPAVRGAGFRLVPEGALYRVVAPPVTGVEPSRRLNIWADGQVRILGYDLPTTTVRAGEPLELTLYQSAPKAMKGIWMPYAQLGAVEDRWTTDSRLLTTQWRPGEVVVERYELPVPFNLPPGEYPLRMGYADLTGGHPALPLSSGGITVDLASVTVLPNPDSPSTRVLEQALANLDNQVALMETRARTGWQARRGSWEEPLTVEAGHPLHLTLTWRALASPRESVKVFVHLIDGAGRPVVGKDAEPLGRSCPTYLWFPKWLVGQTFIDPYRLKLPSDLPSGDYLLEVGMYGATSHRRLPVVDLAGNLAGDRVILGPVRVK